jgi:hypothetical protein
MEKNCLYCQKPLTNSKRKTKEYCDSTCRAYAHRERHNISEPEFLKGVSGILDVEWEDVPVEKTTKVKNPEYLEVEENLNLWELKSKEIQEKHKKLSADYYRIAKQADIMKLGGSGAGILAGAMMSQKSDNILAKLITIGAMGIAGNLLGDALGQQLKENAKHKVLAIQNEMDNLDIEYRAVSFHIENLKDIKKHIQEYIFHKSTEIERKRKPKIKADNETKEEKPINTQYLHKVLANTPIQGISSNELANMEFQTLKLDEPYNSFLGELGEPFTAMICGKPGAGKSTFALQFCYYLATNLGKVLILSTEEGICKTMQDKIKRFNLQSDNLIFPKEIENIKNTNLIGYRFILLDSVNDAKLSSEDLKEIKNKYPKACFIFIFQSNKDGDFKGNQTYLHDVDIKIRVDSGKAVTEKNRFNEVGKELIIYNSTTI